MNGFLERIALRRAQNAKARIGTETKKEEKSKKLCECGCGKEVTKEGNRFISGHNSKGKTHSEETRKKIGEIWKGRKHTEETKKKISEAKKGEKHPFYGKKFSDEHKMKMSEAQRNRVTQPMKGKKLSEETRKKISEAVKGRKSSKETRRKLSEVRKGMKFSEEHRRKLSEVKKGKKFSEETKMKMSEAHKGEKHHSWKGGVIKKNIALYETFAQQLKPIEEVRRRRFKELGEADMQVRCYHCKKWFYPTRNQVDNRIQNLRSGGDGMHFYCKEECKESCSIYSQKKFPKGYLPESNRPYVDPYWRSEVIKRAKGKCERCNEPTSKCGPLIAHHEKPATLFPMLANDIDNGWAVCEPCHYILIHSQEGCGLYELRRIEC